MILRVLEQVQRSSAIAGVLVATDDKRIARVVEEGGGKAVLTGPAGSGTERLYQVVKGDPSLFYIINVQGDEPLFPPSLLDELAVLLTKEKGIVTAATSLLPEELENPDVVKVVLDRRGYALYFSRSPIPWGKDPSIPRFKHLGVYGYTRELLLTFPTLSPSALEKAENLEQLRWLENGIPIRVHTGEYKTIAVDTPEDLTRVERYLLSAKL
jgi:3-deoxy-manno-octulosonate cytidylyltransferase (CMP-KDO synthetase)